MSATIQKLPEIKIIIQEADLIPADMVTEREQYLLCAGGIKSITTANENSMAGQTVVEMRKHVKAIEEMRTTRTRPLLDAQKLLKGFYDSHSENLLAEISRLQRLGTAYIEAENRRVAEEEAERQREFQEAQQAQFSAQTPAQEMLARRKVNQVINTPEPEVNRAKGQTVKQILCYEVTDLMALVKARPDLCKIEAKTSAIKSTCHPNLPIPGLRLWFENQSIYTTR
jgi:hypothetical protein